nr:TolC family protein [Acinetobacter seifertii]
MAGKLRCQVTICQRVNGGKFFQDEQLNKLVDQLNRENASIAQYEAQYRQATALLSEAKAGTRPTITGNTSATRSKSGEASATTSYGFGVNASWEPDFGVKFTRIF